MVAGYDSPCPRLGGTRNNVASHVGIPSHIADRRTLPRSMLREPTIMSQVIRPVAVMMKPEDTPQIIRAREGPARRNPDDDADSSFTAWK